MLVVLCPNKMFHHVFPLRKWFRDAICSLALQVLIAWFFFTNLPWDNLFKEPLIPQWEPWVLFCFRCNSTSFHMRQQCVSCYHVCFGESGTNKMERAGVELKMLRLLLGVSRMVRINNEYIRGTAQVKRDSRCIGHRMLTIELPGRRRRGRAKKKSFRVTVLLT